MSIKIIFKEENEKLFWEKWNEYAASQKSGPLYLKINLEYNLSYFKNFYRDKSFVYLENNQPLACVFLPLEKNGDETAISHSGGYVDAPLALNNSAQKKVFSIIDEIAEENRVAKIKFSIDVLAGVKHNYLIKYNFLDTSILNYLIDLSGDLLKSMRRGHRSDVKDMLKNPEFNVFFLDKKNVSVKAFLEYAELHHKCSGRITRPKITFDLQLEKIRQGVAMLSGLKYKNKSIAFCYFEYYGDQAIYGSAADDPDYDKLPLYHVLIYSGMEYLKQRGARLIDTGQPSCPAPQFDYYPDKKQLNIALFKRGFGGYFKQNFRGIKYFSKEAWKEDLKVFGEQYDFNVKL
ncbi:hypothetical protein A3H66_01715 [Candidatus Falkowbacteria bacterium RIFCSPLOWO2_02_FULL_45_21]|uniref:BioF2-like acetyltransferase domain-containing protein n=1 Tax=Candidatus Falkowbacteria bacterium RIFCSPLOWO2_02_FULL_45_21 TaxID=1797989 RepID=A0A1F5SCG9_9BACT|nr:MAG: hypothetical protein A3H66_01715 [Candidatus Falkowbacteria bacterium RIFCSPLOWO2_02_FULL_45_21]